MPDGDIRSEPGSDRECNSAQSRTSAGDSASFGPDPHRARLLRSLDPMLQTLGCLNQRIGVRGCKRRDLWDHRLARARGWRCGYIETAHDARLEGAQLHLIEKRKQFVGVV